MTIFLTLLMMVLSPAAFSAGGRAAGSPPCDSNAACSALIHAIDERLTVITADVVRQVTTADVVRDAVGQARHLNLWDAERYCESFGLRLPTTREMALVAQSLGAIGVGEAPRTGFEFIRQPAESSYEFYYNSYGYRRPESELGRHWFWTLDPAKRYGGNVSLVFGGGNGTFFEEEVSEALDPPGITANAVVCVTEETPSSGEAVCSSIDGCRALKARAEAWLAAFKTGIPDLTDPPRNADGSVKNMGFGAAQDYCRTLGLRLPTARELATFAQSLGGRVSDTPLATYDEVADFYYSGLGCPQADPALPDGAIWSSTPDPRNRQFNYVLDQDGQMPSMFIDPDHSFSSDGMARCYRGARRP